MSGIARSERSIAVQAPFWKMRSPCRSYAAGRGGPLGRRPEALEAAGSVERLGRTTYRSSSPRMAGPPAQAADEKPSRGPVHRRRGRLPQCRSPQSRRLHPPHAARCPLRRPRAHVPHPQARLPHLPKSDRRPLATISRPLSDLPSNRTPGLRGGSACLRDAFPQVIRVVFASTECISFANHSPGEAGQASRHLLKSSRCGPEPRTGPGPLAPARSRERRPEGRYRRSA
jgi:hypothetical protein